MPSSLAAKRAVVTGAANGIGLAVARRLVAEGARVAMLDVESSVLETAARQLGADVLPLAADVSDEGALAAAVAAAADAWGGLDIVVANAAIEPATEDGRAHELELDVWRRVLDVNLTGVFLTCKHGIQALLAAGGGSVVCTASPTGLLGIAPDETAYSASKAGVVGLVRTLAAAYADDRIRVNGVVPGVTDTHLARAYLEDPGGQEELRRRVPAARAATPDEIAAAIAFLASDESSYVTGALLPVDGGLTAA
ncbi:MAG TPA: SDR family NAD(P)-dependent oxidoreductase [Thermoleophilaceae bacterium]|jgi:NAD(P)-dependent dehydrogenase (short-subunit alcohol dehydrogenase family)